MKKLLSILILSSQLLFGSESNLKYTKNTCNRTYSKECLTTDEQRKNCRECRYSRFEVFDETKGKYVAHIAYDPLLCFIEYLRVDKEDRGKGVGAELAKKAIEDMYLNHKCRNIFLESSGKGERFWEGLGAQQLPIDRYLSVYTFSDPVLSFKKFDPEIKKKILEERDLLQMPYYIAS